VVAVWVAACVLAGIAAARAVGGSNPYAAGVASGAIEDRRLHHFRNASYSETQRLFDTLLDRASRATDVVTRARALAALAALQRERRMENQAAAAAEQARRLAPADPEVRRWLTQPIDLHALGLEP
jgi:hypothetical protein